MKQHLTRVQDASYSLTLVSARPTIYLYSRIKLLTWDKKFLKPVAKSTTLVEQWSSTPSNYKEHRKNGVKSILLTEVNDYFYRLINREIKTIDSPGTQLYL